VPVDHAAGRVRGVVRHRGIVVGAIGTPYRSSLLALDHRVPKIGRAATAPIVAALDAPRSCPIGGVVA
jgi:hypothetical protein